MRELIKAEQLKLKYTFGGKISLISPCTLLVLAFLLTGGRKEDFSAGAWNWWYALFLSGTLSTACYLSVKKDGRLRYHNMRMFPVLPRKCWMAKIFSCAFGLLFSNAVIYLGILLGGILSGGALPGGALSGGALWGTAVSGFGGLSAAVLLTVGFLWEIPVFLFLSARFGMFLSIFAGVILSVSGIVTVSDTSFWWLYPAAVPVRLMCPVLGIMPNGLPVPAESELLGTDVILPGVLLSLMWFVIFCIVTSLWFGRWEDM